MKSEVFERLRNRIPQETKDKVRNYSKMLDSMIKYKVTCKMFDMLTIEIIEAREIRIKDGAYMFWKGEQCEILIASYPVKFTIVTNLEFTNDILRIR